MWFNTYKPVPVVFKPVPKVDNFSGYTVGVTNDDRTILKLSTGYSSLDLLLTDSGVRLLVKLLEATLREENDQSTPKYYESVV